MREILIPLTFDDLPVKPPLVGRPKISEDLQQTAALLVGWDGSTRRLVSVSPTRVLHVASAPVKGIKNLLSAGDGTTQQLEDIKTSEVLIKASMYNTGNTWINVGVAAADNVGHPLDATEWVRFSINNLHSLHFWFEKKDDRISIIYTR
ncbi:unnamed protein product [marine sediment metagenome]|uniref:Uncharacterized protein n=1 Tax=marine sediment metagenome TaxID=412755 RepID=X1UYV7_9ZZZZ